MQVIRCLQLVLGVYLLGFRNHSLCSCSKIIYLLFSSLCLFPVLLRAPPAAVDRFRFHSVTALAWYFYPLNQNSPERSQRNKYGGL